MKKKYRHDTLWLIIQHINKHLTVLPMQNRVRISFRQTDADLPSVERNARAHLRISCVYYFACQIMANSLNARPIIMQYGKRRCRRCERERERKREKKVARLQEEKKVDRSKVFEVYFRCILQINHHYVLATKAQL